MGAYQYLLRSPKLARQVRVIRPDKSEESIRVASVGYAFKPSWSFPEPKWVKSVIARMREAWGVNRPLFAAQTARLDANLEMLPASKRFQVEIGQSVYHWPEREVPFSMTDAGGAIGVFYGTVV